MPDIDLHKPAGRIESYLILILNMPKTQVEASF